MPNDPDAFAHTAQRRPPHPHRALHLRGPCHRAAASEPCRLDYYTSVVTRMMIYAIAALSLDLILGYGALVSFGHAAFFGIGAYAALFLQTRGITDFFLHLAGQALRPPPSRS
ncbi:hypothetical protein [Gemmobacter sp. 24YEA27]|uniref:ABC transporter permease subunit n=1 Tax=Gemmobacter sp. 24YEA27 TaxID=3040672 RepID=UPI0024B35C25|nr:hypothetical protein [Gemmobacter sp. 24YEA27]